MKHNNKNENSDYISNIHNNIWQICTEIFYKNELQPGGDTKIHYPRGKIF